MSPLFFSGIQQKSHKNPGRGSNLVPPELVKVQAGGAHSYHCPIMGKTEVRENTVAQ
jgi:hypothetical protein